MLHQAGCLCTVFQGYSLCAIRCCGISEAARNRDACEWPAQDRSDHIGSNCRRGEDPEHDAAEKALLRTARRGVVRLFNAVSKAQKQTTEQQVAGSRAKVDSLPT